MTDRRSAPPKSTNQKSILLNAEENNRLFGLIGQKRFVSIRIVLHNYLKLTAFLLSSSTISIIIHFNKFKKYLVIYMCDIGIKHRQKINT